MNLPPTNFRCATPLRSLTGRLLCLRELITYRANAITLESTANRLEEESKFREAQETRLDYYKTAAKAVFLSYILCNPHTPGKFRDHFAWVEMPIQERAFRAVCEEPSAKYLLRTLTEAPQFFTSDDMQYNDIEEIREMFGFVLGAPRARSEPPSDRMFL